MSGACACGCGQLTILGRVAEATTPGRTRKDVAAALGMDYDHLKIVLLHPPRFLKGHSPITLASRAETAKRQAAQLRDLEQSQLRKSSQLVGRTRNEALARDLRAFDLLMLAPFVHRPTPNPSSLARAIKDVTTQALVQVRYERRLAKASERRVQVELRRQQREQDREQIAYLRNMVGVGWNQDSDAPSFKLVSLDAIKERWGNDDWYQYQMQREEQERIEEEHQAAAAVLASGPIANLTRIALASPQNLRESERMILRHYYQMAREGKGLPLRHHEMGKLWDGYQPKPPGSPAETTGGPASGGGWSHGRGSGRHSFPGVTGQKRHEGKEQIALERAIRQVARA